MDIFKYAEEYDADYHDVIRGRIYKVQNYNLAKKRGLPARMEVVDDMTGELIGYVEEKEKEE